MSDLDLLSKGDLIKSRWEIMRKIGGGGFGQIYEAFDKLRRESVAVKVESNCQPRQGIRMEVTVLRRIRERQHVCELFSGGTSSLYNYMIMTLLGSSLSELRRLLPEQCFSLSTSLRISIQILEAIESIHTIGFLHRDIKPSNFAIGREERNCRQIFILDFGLARKYTDYDQHVRPARCQAGFRGTIRYASVNAHNSRELGRHDDLWSFFYMLIEFLIGSLPWSKIKDKESVGRMKETYDYTRFLAYLPEEFDKFLEHINELHYEDVPHYEFLRSLFISAIQRLGYNENDPFDWEKTSSDGETQICLQDDDRKTIPESLKRIKSFNTRRDLARTRIRSPTPNLYELSGTHGTTDLHHENRYADVVSPLKPRPMLKSSSRTGHLRKVTEGSSHDSSQQPPPRPINNRPMISSRVNKIKSDSETRDRHRLAVAKVWPPPDSRSPDTITRRSTNFSMVDHRQATSNGLLTFISQHLTNAAAPGTASLFSQCSPLNGETYTDDDALKISKSNSSKGDERISSTIARLTPPNSSTKNNSAGQSHAINSNKPRKSQRFSDDDDDDHEQPINNIPFVTYIKTTRRNSNLHRTSPNLQKFCKNNCF